MPPARRKTRAGGTAAGPPAPPAPPAARRPTFEDVVSNAINAHAIAAFLRPFELVARMMPLSRACAAAAVALLRQTRVVELPDLDEASGELLASQLATHLQSDVETELTLPSCGGSSGAWMRSILSSTDFSALRELTVNASDEATVAAAISCVSASAGTLEVITLTYWFGDVVQCSMRKALGRNLGRCRRLKKLSICTNLLEWTPATPCLHPDVALMRLELTGLNDDADLAVQNAAPLIEHAVVAGTLQCLALVAICTPSDPAAASLQRTLTAALPRIPDLSFRGFDGTWTIPRLPRLLKLEWDGGEGDYGDFATLARLLRHAPALQSVKVANVETNAAALAAAISERCHECDAGAGRAITSIAVDSLRALRLLASLPLTDRLTSLELQSDSLDGSDAALDVLVSLPPSITRLAVWCGYAMPAKQQPIVMTLAPFAALQSLVVTSGAASKQAMILRAAHYLRRPPPIRVTFEDGYGAELSAQLALPAAEREPWMAALA